MATETTGSKEILFGYTEAKMDLQTGRFQIPLELYDKLGERKLRMTVDPLGRFLELRTEAKFQDLAIRIQESGDTLEPETIAALMTEYLAFSTEVQIDNILRLVVPKMMRDPLEGSTELALVAVGDALRVWSLKKYKASEAERREPLKRDYAKIVGLTLGLKPRAVAAPAPRLEPEG